MLSLSLTLVCDSARTASLFWSNWQLRWPEAALNVEPCRRSRLKRSESGKPMNGYYICCVFRASYFRFSRVRRSFYLDSTPKTRDWNTSVTGTQPGSREFTPHPLDGYLWDRYGLSGGYAETKRVRGVGFRPKYLPTHEPFPESLINSSPWGLQAR